MKSLSDLSAGLTDREVLVCFVQQAQAAGAIFSLHVSGRLTLKTTCPKVQDDVVEVLGFLRQLASQSNFQINQNLQRMVTGPDGMKLGGINWQPIPTKKSLPESTWVFTEHQQILVRDRIGKQVWMSGDVPTGRLEGCAPQRCFITPAPWPEPTGSAVARFCQRVQNAVPFAALAVSGRPPAAIKQKPPERLDTPIFTPINRKEA